MTESELIKIASSFDIDGKPVSATPWGSGLINDTFLVKTANRSTPDYILQKINDSIFADVEMLQSNIVAVTSHIRKKLEEYGEEDIDRKVLTFIPDASGKTYVKAGGRYWRLSVFIQRSVTHDTVNPYYARHAGNAFGNFEYMLSDMHDALGETIPDFHNMEFRLRQFMQAVDEDKAGRLREVEYFREEILSRSETMCAAERMFREGKLPKRICHCDTKVNNMLFDENGKVLCVIDLDTVMPNFVFSDYGDFLRTAANTGKEDDENPENVNFNMEIFMAFTEGYLETAGKFLLPVETENLPFAAKLFPYMQCVRFLTDYLNGDTYYKTAYPEHNLVRAKAQFKLLQSAESQNDRMNDFIASVMDRHQQPVFNKVK